MKIFDAIQQITPCPVTRSTGCQCDRLGRINEAEGTIKAIAQLEHTVGDVQGAVKFKQKPGQPTIIKGIVKGLTPGKHGFHIHEFGDLSKGCESAGGHYNPDGVDHGSLQQGHVGDLGNIVADKSGTARFQIKAERVELSDIVGRAIVFHADEDDLGKGGDKESLKTGNAGERVGCGVIRLREVVEEEYERKISDKHFDRNQLPQIRRPDVQNSPFKYKEGSISLSKLKPVQSQRVKGLSKKAQDIYLNNEDRPFIVDKNGYIINGHHRYDAANMLSIKKVPAIMIDADIEDVMNHFAHTTSDREVMPEHYFKKLYEKKLKEQEATKGNFGGVMYPQLPHQEVLDAISSWEYGDTPIELTNGYVINAREEGYNADDNAWVLLDPQGKIVDDGEGSIEDVMQDFTPILIDESGTENFAEGKHHPDWYAHDELALIVQRYLGNNMSKGFEFRKLEQKLLTQNTDTLPIEYTVTDIHKQDKDMLNQWLKRHKIPIKIMQIHEFDFGGAAYKILKPATDPQYKAGDWDVDENFADGKKKGKSRPGRVKKAGASCKGSVTDLRAKAKKYSGEKGKMYHWCANMKSGRKKS